MIYPLPAAERVLWEFDGREGYIIMYIPPGFFGAGRESGHLGVRGRVLQRASRGCLCRNGGFLFNLLENYTFCVKILAFLFTQ